VKNGNKVLAISTGTEDGTDSLLLLSNDNGRTCMNITSPHFFEYGFNYLSRISQHPDNGNSILVLPANSEISRSNDFGLSWKNLNEYGLGFQNWYLDFHPLDTTTLFAAGEESFYAGTIKKSSDNGENWSSTCSIHNNCIHSIAFHPTNPNILVFGGETVIGKSVDKGETWNVINLYSTRMYFCKVLFDEENPAILYSSGLNRKSDVVNDTVWVYRSTDMGNSWQLVYNENLNKDCGGVVDMVKYKDKLIFYTRNCGLFELDLGTNTSIHKISPDTEKTIMGYFNILGQKLLKEPACGIFMILYSNGETEKRMK
jgi:photosystem II stability/assembly factor-like uncharacterized protein